MEPVTAIFFSCRRLNLLERTIDAFVEHNSYPMQEIIIVNDSADTKIWEQLKRDYPDFTLVLNKENVGLFKSVDLGYEHVKTNYHFLCEDDWMVTKGGFMEKCLAIMLDHPEIEETWLKDYNNHPMEDAVYYSRGVPYKLAAKNIFKDKNGFIYGWHGFTTSCALKRMSDYRRVPPYDLVAKSYPGKRKTIWDREHAIGEEYNKLGYRTAILIDDEYATNIGIGQSEYKTGGEK